MIDFLTFWNSVFLEARHPEIVEFRNSEIQLMAAKLPEIQTFRNSEIWPMAAKPWVEPPNF